MIFAYILIIALVGIGLLVYFEQKKTQQSMLQIIKNWCSIDSIQFERGLTKGKNYLSQMEKSVIDFIYKIVKVSARHGKGMRKTIRKKFDSHHLPKESSVFIQDLKNEIRSK
jgi:hypothetical protein